MVSISMNASTDESKISTPVSAFIIIQYREEEHKRDKETVISGILEVYPLSEH